MDNRHITCEPNGLRVFVVGDFIWPWYQEACSSALEVLGCKVKRFGWFGSFLYWDNDCSEPIYRSIWRRLQYRLLTGPAIWSINKKIISSVNSF